MECFSYKGGCVVCGCVVCECMRIEIFKRRVGLGYRNGYRLLAIKCYLNSCTTKKLKNKAVSILKQYYMHCYVTLSNVF